MKRLNVKLLLILVVTVVVLSTGVAVVHAIQMNRNADSLLKRAESAKSSGDSTQAIFYFRRYLYYKQQDIERFAEYAMLTAAAAETPGSTAQQYAGALRDLQSVLLADRSRRADRLSDKSRTDIRRKLIDLEMATQQSQLIAAARTLLLEMKSKGETNAEDDMKLARCQIALGHYLEGVKQLEALIGYNAESKSFDDAKATLPKDVDAYLVLANLLREKIADAEISDRADVADRVIDQLVKVNKDSVKALLGRARYLQQNYSREKAKPAFDKALELAPNDADVLLQAAEMAAQANDYNAAESLLKKGIKEHPQEDRMYFTLAYLAKVQNNRKLVMERLETGLKVFPTSPILLQMLFDQQLEDRDAKSARLTLQKLAATKYSSMLKEFREAELLTLEGDYLEASRHLEKLRPQLSKASENTGNAYYVAQTDYMLMQCYQQLGQYDLTLTTARRFAAESHSLEAEMGIGAALMALGKTDEAKSQFERLLAYLSSIKREAVAPQICHALVQLRVAEQMRLPEESRNWGSVSSYVAELQRRGLIQEPIGSLMLADILAHKGDKQESRKLLDRLAQQFPDNSLILNARVELALQERDLEGASRLIKSAPAQLHDASLTLGRIDVILLRDNTKNDKLQELEALGVEIDKQKMSDAERAQIHGALGTAYQRLGEMDRTIQQIKNAATLQPRNAQIRWHLYDLLRENLDTNKLKDLAEWFGNEFGRESAQAKLVDAAVLITSVREDQRTRGTGKQQAAELSASQRRDLQTARDMLRAVENLRPDWYERPKLLTEIDVLESKPDEAIIDLREVLRLGPPDPIQVHRLAQLLLMQKRYSEVKEVLDTYGTKANKGLERIEAVNDQLSGRPDLALQRLESLIPKDSTNASDHLYYGQLLASAGKSEQAETELRRAVELAPQQPETWLGLVYFLMASGRRDEARKAVQESQIQLPEDRRILAIAQGYEIVGDRQLADQFYRAALDAAPNDPKTQRFVATYYLRNQQSELAKPLVNALLNLKPSNPAEREILGWARRSTAQMLANDGNYQNFLKALQYLSPQQGEPASAADISMRAFMLGNRTDLESAQGALSALQELKNIRALSTEERMLLSQLYERTGNWTAARDELLALLNQSNAGATGYSMFIEMLLRRNSPESALPWLQKLEAFSRSNPLLVATVAAHVASVQGNNAQVVARMMRLLPTERPLPKDKVESLRMVADLLGQLEQYDKAEELWREYVTYMPQKSSDLATFLAKRGKIDEALQLAEQRRKADPPVTVLSVATAAAKQRIHPLTAPQAQQLEQWFQSAMRDDPDSIPVQILWAEFLDSQGRYDELEKAYRAILALPDLAPKDRVVVANNLAFALALQGHQLDDALKLSNETIAFLGPVAEALDTRGLIYLAKGNTKKAVQDLTEAVSVLNPQAVTYAHLAMAQAAGKDLSSARHSLDRAKEEKLNPDDLSPLDRKKFDALQELLNKPS